MDNSSEISSLDTVKVIDNFLPRDTFLHIREGILDTGFPWFFMDHTVDASDRERGGCKNYKYSHLIYDSMLSSRKSYEWEFNTMVNEFLKPFYEQLNPWMLMRVVAHSTTYTGDTSYVSDWHVDQHGPHTKTMRAAVFCFNTCNARTCFLDGSEIESVENRLMTFPMRLQHRVRTATNVKRRVIINVNYFPNDI